MGFQIFAKLRCILEFTLQWAFYDNGWTTCCIVILFLKMQLCFHSATRFMSRVKCV